MLFEKLGLRPEILVGVRNQGYTEPTPIQEQAIPVILKGRDILAGAQTGTGKTAAFTLPLLHLLSSKNKNRGNAPRALVLTPTRELAAQVGESIKTYGHGLKMRTTIVFGGVSINPQIQCLRKGVDIVIGTPGRLLDLMGQRILDLSHIDFLILDEADRMLDMGFINDIRKIIRQVPANRQTLFFSATYSKKIKELADTILSNPKLVEVARQNTAAENVDQSVYLVPKSRKRELLSHLIHEGHWSQVLVFSRTRHGANRLAKQLMIDGITATAIHGDKSQGARTRALAEFKAGHVRVLVATDIASRGLDIDRLPHVVNYELPEVPEDYVHRIGRTGRAGCSGKAISLVMNDEVKRLRAIESLIKKSIPVNKIDGFSEPKVLHNNESSNKNGQRPRSRGGNKSGFKGNNRPNRRRSGRSRDQ